MPNYPINDQSQVDETQLDAYDYHLPEQQIAQVPVNSRDSSRLMVIDRKKGTWEGLKHASAKYVPGLIF